MDKSLHCVDIKTKEMVGIEVINETVSDHEKFEDLIESAEGRSDVTPFSAVKRIFGESVRASSIKGMFHEVKCK